MKHEKRAGRTAAIVTAMSLLVQPAGPLIGGERQTATRPAVPPIQTPSKPTPAPTPASAPSAAKTPAAPVPVDGGWPRMYSLPSGGTMLVYQPQIASWDRQAHLVAFSAVSYRPKAGDKPSMGTFKLEADTKVSVPDRLVNFQQMKIVEANFQALPKEQIREMTAEIDKAIPDDERVIALDRVLANVDKSEIVPKNVEGIKADPPPIFFSKTPAVIVVLDGEPIWSPIKENDLEVRRQHELGSVPVRADEHLLSAQQRYLAERHPISKAHGRRPVRCPTVSRSCQRRTTGRMSWRICPGNRFRSRRSPRSSSASFPPSSFC